MRNFGTMVPLLMLAVACSADPPTAPPTLEEALGSVPDDARREDMRAKLERAGAFDLSDAVQEGIAKGILDHEWKRRAEEQRRAERARCAHVRHRADRAAVCTRCGAEWRGGRYCTSCKARVTVPRGKAKHHAS